jgi:hypothetical protein
MDTRMKNCTICDKSPSSGENAVEHDCFKNWTASSQSMEPDILVEGFRRSLFDHNLVYRYVVADADSSVYSKLQTNVVYPGRIPIEKVDCKNHGVRGLNSKIYSIIHNTAYAKPTRDLIEKTLSR